LADLDLGFDPSNVLTFDLDRLDQGRYPTHAARHRVIDALLANIERLPGVRSAAAVLLRPFGAGVIGWDTGLLLEAQPDTPTTWMTNPIVNWEAVTPRYFETMGIRLLRGRDFATTDRAGTPMVVIVSELLAERAWPGQDPLGKRLIDGFVGGGMGARLQRWQTVVGVVESAQYRTLDQPRPDLYVPLAQAGDSDAAHAVIRTTGDPRSMAPQIGALLSHVDPQLANTGFTTMDEVVAQVQAPWRFNMQLFSAFGFAAIGITALGIVGLVASMVNWRRREIGVRLALGGQPQQVVSMILREGFGLVGVGVAIGLFVSLLASRLLSGLLFGISASDPATFAAMGLAVAALGTIACYLPARRAAAVDPCIVFRDE
jgi:putative ABC transport system permease protein